MSDLLQVRDLHVTFVTPDRTVHAVNGVSFHLDFHTIPFHGQDASRYGRREKEPAALDELRRTWLTRPEGPDEFRDWVATGRAGRGRGGR